MVAATAQRTQPAGPAPESDAIAFRAIGTLVKLAGIIDELEAIAREPDAAAALEPTERDRLKAVIVRSCVQLRNTMRYAHGQLIGQYLDIEWAEAMTEAVNLIAGACHGPITIDDLRRAGGCLYTGGAA